MDLPLNTVRSPRRLAGWAIIFGVWSTFGLGTILNSAALRLMEIDVPDSMPEAIWLVIGIWLGGLLAALTVALIEPSPQQRFATVGGVAIGYSIGALLRLAFVGVFPGLPASPFAALVDITRLQPIPVYYGFLLLVLVIGPTLVGVTALIARGDAELHLSRRRRGFEVRLAPRADVDSAPPQLMLDPQAFLFAAFVPLALWVFLLGLLNWRDYDLAKDLRYQSSLIGQSVSSILILNLDTLINARTSIVLAGLAGSAIAARPIEPKRAALNAGLGLAIYVVLL
ncbi:MAG: hypothetical protein GYB66_03590, partial [Chloroflexi bacterium]|nr:hypothetical protein [Chloroflexota bacterium]